jgi:GNAT superfamily N-acetyltransferase
MTMGLDRRPLAPDEAGDWVALLNAIQDADGSDDYTGEQQLLEAFSQPDQEFASGSIAIYDGLTMIGYGLLARRGVADPVHDMRHEGGVHPSYRGRGLGGELLDWAEKTAVPLHNDRFPGRPLSLSSGCLSSNAGAVALHEQRGYQPVRWFHSMVALVGTRAAGRKRGIATALLIAAMSAARADGYDQASLGVDADSLTDAVRLYEHVGFTVALTWTAYRKRLA